ncbi:MAG: hypothetical protein D6B26_01420 [Spirochaetaceae bacterium]|nr:MAG: hypothetical protein D6B26_01420 [Spirochaetaceae bacterium]
MGRYFTLFKRIKAFKVLFVLALVFMGAAELSAASFSFGLGGEFFNYQQAYLAMQGSYMREITENVELDLGATFGIRVEEQLPGFLLPMHVGFQFLFPNFPGSVGALGVGVTPVAMWGSSQLGNRFFAGPYIKFGIRVPVHPFMRWYIEAQQNLLIGAPSWINTGTRVNTGIHFFFH